MIVLFAIFSANAGEYGFSHGNQQLQLSRAGALAHNFESIVWALVIVSFFIVLFGWSRLRDVLEQREKGSRLPLASFVAAMIGVALVLVAVPLSLGQNSATSTGCLRLVGQKSSYNCVTVNHGLTVAQFVAYTGLGLIIVAFVLAPFVIARAVRSSDLPIESLHSGSRVATALSTLFVIMAMAISACGVATSLQPTPQKGMNYLLERSALGGWFVLLVLGFVTMAVISSLGTFTARRSYGRAVALGSESLPV
jgi:uncharacterized membrane protein YidH (DUF202 family)